MFSKTADKVKDAYAFVMANKQHLPHAFHAIFAFGCKVRLLRGQLQGTRETIDVLYIGRGSNYAYLVRAVFDESRVVDSVDASLLTFRTAASRMAGNADVVIVDIGWPYHALVNKTGEYLVTPDWVNMVVELPEIWERVLGNFAASTRRKVRRSPYRCALTNAREAIEAFYDDMYVPFIQRRFADASVIHSRRHVMKKAVRGRLLHVLRGDDVVAAGVVYPVDDTLCYLWPGIPAAFLDAPAEGAMDALYFFIIRHAFDAGYRYVDFSGTRPFLTDGVLQHKRRWGAAVEDCFSPGSFLIKPKNGSRKAAMFCRQLPVLARCGDELEARFLSLGEPMDDRALRLLRRRFGCDGVDRMTVLVVSDAGEYRDVSADGNACACRVVSCSLDNFADHYVC